MVAGRPGEPSRTHPLEPSASDAPGPGRRVSLAAYADYDDFLYRLPKYLGDINHRLEERVREIGDTDARVGEARGLIMGTKRRMAKAAERRSR